jgi:hypothetical protein
LLAARVVEGRLSTLVAVSVLTELSLSKIRIAA